MCRIEDLKDEIGICFSILSPIDKEIEKQEAEISRLEKSIKDNAQSFLASSIIETKIKSLKKGLRKFKESFNELH